MSLQSYVAEVAGQMGIGYAELVSGWAEAAGKERAVVERLIETGNLEEYEHVPHLGFVTAPGQDLGYATINKDGYRGKLAGAKPPGTVRVVLLGGSAAWGRGATAEEETIAAHLERALRAKGPGRAWEVVNLAMPAFLSLQELLWWHLWSGRLEADFVVDLSGPNDVFHAWETGRVNANSRSHPLPPRTTTFQRILARLRRPRGDAHASEDIELPEFTYTVW